jgi:ribonuclease HI
MVLSIYTDGSCCPNPGEMKIGVIAMRGPTPVHSFSRSMGVGTSNQAELLAIREALSWASPAEEIVLNVDSRYAIGVISKNWMVSKNLELVHEIQRLFRSFPRIRMVKVRGHAGVLGNEMADALAG